MALGDVTTTIANQSHVVELLASATATNGTPTSTAGIEVNALKIGAFMPDECRIGIRSTAGSGTMTVTLRAWIRAGGIWFRALDLNASSAAPHTAVAIPETGTDSILFSERLSGLRGADRIYLEVVAIAGTSTAVTGYAIVGR